MIKGVKIKQKTRKKINRSGKHPCQICNTASILVGHHINGRNVQDCNKSWNIVNVCDNCHRLIHENVIVVEKWCYTTIGLELIWHRNGEECVTGEQSKTYIIPKK